MAVCMRKELAMPRVGVFVCHLPHCLFSLIYWYTDHRSAKRADPPSHTHAVGGLFCSLTPTLFNTNKCNVFRVSRAQSQIPFTYNLNSIALQGRGHTKHRLVSVSQKTSSGSHHVSEATAKANCFRGSLKRSF